MKWYDHEIWVDVNEFPNYRVSTFGNIESKLTNKILRPQNNGNGYFKVSLRKDGKTYQRYIHRLVALEFVSCRVCCNEVDHIDLNKSNNKVRNLRWVNRSMNATNMCRKNRIGYKLKQVTKEDKNKILMLKDKGLTNVQISKELGIARQTVYYYTK